MNTPVKIVNDRSLALIFLFAFTLFASAALMFVLQPMFGKILLPLLGGSPAVWNTCMVFYQSVLFLGYLYAHFLSTRLAKHHQIIVHIGLILLSLLALPVGLPHNVSPPTESNPTLWLIGILGVSIGLPFFVVSTTAPLIQKWFANVGHHTSDDPYYLYAASNAGSLTALLSYPFLIEPRIGLSEQKLDWSIGFGLLGLMIAGCAFMLWKTHQQQAEDQDEIISDEINLFTKLHWLALALVPSSLLLGLTTFISTDIASVPLLWIIPLTLYLLTFILVFSKWQDRIHPLMLSIQPIILLPFLAYSFINPAVLPYWVDLGLHLAAFFLAVMVCHGELARLRPTTRHLTTYYLIMSFAGMLGGMFNTFVAPFIFNAVYEYPLMIIAALLLRPGLKASLGESKEQWLKQLIFPLALLVIGLKIFYLSNDDLPQYLDTIGVGLILLAGLTYAFRTQPLALGLLTAVLIFFTFGLHGLLSHTLYQERTFFGVLSVRESMMNDEEGRPEKYREFFHGTTKHGAQRLGVNDSRTPTTYFSHQGPIGQLFNVYDKVNSNWDIGIIGLGAGTLSCYTKEGQKWTFYELDPLVIDIASNPKYFTFISQCNPQIRMVPGDARLSLEKEPAQKFDLFVVDAFSSDSIPTHLLTQEAIKLYFDKIKPDGILALHITNRHLALKKVLSDHAQQLHLAALIQEFKPQQEIPLVIATDWIVMAKKAETLEPLKQSQLANWQKLPLYFDIKPWTDDFTNIVSIWK